MSYLGNYAEDYADLNFKFQSRNTSQVPFTLGGTPAISVYKSNDTTQTTAGVTLTTDFDSITGCNNVKIDLSADAFYVTGEDYQVVITTGTVDGTSVVGAVVAEFSIENRFEEVTLAAKTHTGATVPTVSVLTGHTAQTGDSFARLGAPAGASVSADIAAITSWSIIPSGDDEISLNATAGGRAIATVGSALTQPTTATYGVFAVVGGAEVVTNSGLTVTDTGGLIDWQVASNAGATEYVNGAAFEVRAKGGTLDGQSITGARVGTFKIKTFVAGTVFDGITSLAEWLGLIAGKQVGDATARTEIRATGAGSGTYDETVDSQEAIKDTALTQQLVADSARLLATGAVNAGSMENLVTTLITTGGSGPWTASAGALVSTTIATLTSQTSFTLTAGSSDNNAYVGAMAVITDQATQAQKAVGWVSAYVGGGTRGVTLASDPGVFTMAVGDTIDIVAVPKQIDAAISSRATPQQVADAARVPATGALQAGSMEELVTLLITSVPNKSDWANATAPTRLLTAPTNLTTDGTAVVNEHYYITANVEFGNGTTDDFYSFQWHTIAGQVDTGITAPKLFARAIKAQTTLLNDVTPTADAVKAGTFYYSAASPNIAAAGDVVMVYAKATINGSERTSRVLFFPKRD